MTILIIDEGIAGVRSNADFTLLCERLESNDQKILTVNVIYHSKYGGIRLKDSQAKTLADSLQNNTNVKNLFINIEELTVRGAVHLMKFISSSQHLNVLVLQGCASSDPEEFPNQALAVHVLAGASFRNPSSIDLQLASCHIARSTLLSIFGATSNLSSFSMSGPFTLIVDDDDDPTLEQMPFSGTLQYITYNWEVSTDEIELADLVLKCSACLPNLTNIRIRNAPENISLEPLLNSKSLKKMEFRNKEVRDHQSIVKFLQKTDSLDNLMLQLPRASSEQRDELSDVIRNNYSLISIEQDICPRIDGYCSRNREFLRLWQDLSFNVSCEVWPWAIETACYSERGRSALWHRLPLMLSSIPSIRRNSYHIDTKAK